MHAARRSAGGDELLSHTLSLSSSRLGGVSAGGATLFAPSAMRRALCCSAVGADAPPTPDARAPSPPPPSPKAVPPVVAAAAGEAPSDAPYDTLLELSLLGAHPHPEALATPFHFRGVDLERETTHARLRCSATTDAAVIFDWVGEWLCEPAEAITLLLHAAGNVSLTRATAAGRDVAHAGLAAARFSVVLVAPRCGICLEQRAPPPSGARHPALLAAGVQAPDGWACRAAGGSSPPHYFCRGCMSSHLEVLLARPGVPPPARLLCPQPGCTRVLSDAELSWLIGEPRLRAYAEARAAGHRGRLEDITSGREGGPDLALWAEQHAQACPGCSVLVERSTGCAHMSCPCGCHFYWVKSMAYSA